MLLECSWSAPGVAGSVAPCMSDSGHLLHDMRSLLLSSHNQAWGLSHQNWREPFCKISVILNRLENEVREFERSFGPIP